LIESDGQHFLQDKLFVQVTADIRIEVNGIQKECFHVIGFYVETKVGDAVGLRVGDGRVAGGKCDGQAAPCSTDVKKDRQWIHVRPFIDIEIDARPEGSMVRRECV